MAIIDSTLTSRYELKYILKPDRVEAVESYCRPFVQLDLYSAKTGDGYTINSLYLDTEDLDCYEATNDGHKTRFKLRIRTYDEFQGPVFFEIKKRLGRLIRKSRAQVDPQIAADLLAGRFGEIRAKSGRQSQDFNEFLHVSQKDPYYPIVFVRYRRKAYESLGVDPVRITFDTELEYAVAHDAALSTEGLTWHEIPIPGVVLEIKFTDRCPSWAVELVHFFQLQRRSVSKYGRSVAAALRADLKLPATMPGTTTRALLAQP